MVLLFMQIDSRYLPSFCLSSPSDGDVETLLREKEKKVRPFSMFDSMDQSTGVPALGLLRKNQSSEDLLRDAQVCRKK